VAERKKTAKPAANKTAAAKTVKTVKPSRQPRKWTKPFRAVGGYFKGAWVELRQVRWPDRKATWGLTLAVIAFSLFFALVILGLDAVFSYLFKEVLL
jgi:preprotein translocase SecE subunit